VRAPRYCISTLSIKKSDIPIRSLLRTSNILTLVCCWFAKVYTNLCKIARPDDNTICAQRCNIKHRVNVSHHVHLSCNIRASMQGESIHLKSRYCMQWHLQIMVSLHKRSQRSNVDIWQVQPTQQRMMTRGRVQTQSQTVHHPNFN